MSSLIRLMYISGYIFVSSCSFTYIANDEKFVSELKRVADEMTEVKKRDSAILKIRSELIQQQRELLNEHRAARVATEELTKAIIGNLDSQRCIDPLSPRTLVPNSGLQYEMIW